MYNNQQGFTPYHFYYVYVLQSIPNPKELYIGSTNDISRRLKEHNRGDSQSTKRYMPWRLKYYEAFSDEKSARERESNLKNNGNPMRELKKRIDISSDNKSDKGFIALISVILISFMLFAITYAVGMTSFLSRFNILDSESKKRSGALAEACLDQAILKITSEEYLQNQEILVGPKPEDKCVIISTTQNVPTAGKTIIKTQSVINKSYTNLFIIIDDDFNIIRWQECPNFTASGNSC